jgi:hypothetical protein
VVIATVRLARFFRNGLGERGEGESCASKVENDDDGLFEEARWRSRDSDEKSGREIVVRL